MLTNLYWQSHNKQWRNFDKTFTHPYRLIDKYMSQPRLMKLNRADIDENYLSSDLVSIALPYFLNRSYRSLKCSMQFFLIDIPQNFFRHSQNWSSSATWIFSSFFQYRKQVEFDGSQIRWTGWMWLDAHVIFFEPICWSPICVNWAIVETNYKSFLMRHPSSRKDRLFKWSD
jgi:hypothetical protein